jgi:hypothetical protein
MTDADWNQVQAHRKVTDQPMTQSNTANKRTGSTGNKEKYHDASTKITISLPSHGVNVAKYFDHWLFSSCESIDHFALVPYKDEKGQQISSLEQVPEDNMDFYSAYYHNDHVLNHGI